jgi:hypothetical protein
MKSILISAFQGVVNERNQQRLKAIRWIKGFGAAYLVCLAISSRTLGTRALGISMNVWDVSS